MFYTYLYLRQDGTPYYVGKGTGNRAWKKNSRNVPVPADHSYILIQDFVTEKDALDAEIFLIAYYGRKDKGVGCLRNLTDGGDGLCNPSEEVRRKIGEAVRVALTSRKISAAQLQKRIGRISTPEHCANISRSMLGKKNGKGWPKGKRRSNSCRRYEPRTHCARGHELLPANVDAHDGCKRCHNWARDEKRRTDRESRRFASVVGQTPS